MGLLAPIVPPTHVSDSDTMDVDEPESRDTGLVDGPSLRREQLRRLLETVGTG